MLLLFDTSDISLSLSVVVVLQLPFVRRGVNPNVFEIDEVGTPGSIPADECSDALSSKLPVDRLLEITKWGEMKTKVCK